MPSLPPFLLPRPLEPLEWGMVREKLLEGGSKQKNWVEGRHWGCQRVAPRKRDPVEGGRTPEPTPTVQGPTLWPTFPNETHRVTNRAKQVK